MADKTTEVHRPTKWRLVTLLKGLVSNNARIQWA